MIGQNRPSGAPDPQVDRGAEPQILFTLIIQGSALAIFVSSSGVTDSRLTTDSLKAPGTAAVEGIPYPTSPPNTPS
ncbi:hypothetical protein E4U17_001341 [Claviceps sp. LM77 group G4]|nr:hypothetical protein E4U17_001341 [Claviceps sp. LM77 group G4]KAG6049986.1 hypothetical protein E4U33_000762 [Claviceps sp. LM78 group G4]KAG6066629.1 hypothetical protein E4U16_000224 [Claviceps sp. LM84 group G4]